MTDDVQVLKAVAKRNKWKLSGMKRAFLIEGTDEGGAAMPPRAEAGDA